MQYTLPCTLVTLLAITLCNVGCSIPQGILPQVKSVVTEPSLKVDYASVEDVSVGSEPLGPKPQDRELFEPEVRKLIARRDFKELDNYAANLRDSKARFEKGGGWKIYSFYNVASEPAKATEKAWVEHIKVLTDWKRSTGSITARTTLASAYRNWAWEIRGSGYASEVKTEVWPVVEERLRKGWMELVTAREISDRCPGFFDTFLDMARATSLGRAEFNQLFEEAVRYEPTYHYFYVSKAEYLLPRWSGRPGELVEFAESLIKTMGEEKGLEYYYLISADLSTYKHDDYFKETGLSWRKTKKGFLLHQKKYGASHFRVGQFLQAAWKAWDNPAVCNTAKRLTSDDDFDPEIFPTADSITYMKNLGRSLCQLPKFDNQAL